MFDSWSSLFSTAATVAGGLAAVTAYILWHFPWLRLDFRMIRLYGLLFTKFRHYMKSRTFQVDFLTQRAMTQPKKACLIFQDNVYTFEFMEKQVNKAAHAYQALGVKKGDTVAMLLHNEPAFVWTYLGILKVGGQAAFLNYNLRSKSLYHCFEVSEAKVLIVGQDEDLVDAVEEISPELSKLGVKVFVQGNNNRLPADFNSWEATFQDASEAPVPKSLRDGIKFNDAACYIYTSGTTGLPKAARVTHSKTLKGAQLPSLVGLRSDDIFYTPLPMYHSAAGVIALGSTLEKGCTLVLRNKFSATHFWDDCIKYDVTAIQYIGELCRYLLTRPPSPKDYGHKVRLAIGNGLRRDIWKDFQDRFNIPIIGEFYAATEGNAGFINIDNKFGSVGRQSPLFSLLYPAYFIKYDIVHDEPVRDKNGLCIQADLDEPGLFVGKIKQNFEFDGYRGSKELTSKKILRNVFKKGDTYFNSGDLLTRDKDYYVYFNDRIGDTFRWKGENVSTTEVSNVISDVSEVVDASVYGVPIPGQDGKAGMAAISLGLEKSTGDITSSLLGDIYVKCTKLLPSYAIPRFLRFQTELTVTGTLKQRKVELVQEGFNPSKTGSDPVFYLDLINKQFSPFSEEVYEKVLNGKIRF